MRKFWNTMLAVFALSLAALAQCPTANQPGTGSDIPSNVQLQGQCLIKNTNVSITSWFSNTPGKLQITFATVNPADTSVNLDVNHNYGYSGPAAQRIVHDQSFVTSHTIVLDHIPAGREQLLIPGDCDQGGSGSYYTATNCSRFDPHGSTGGYSQSAQTFGYIFTSPPANPAHTLLWEFMPSVSTEVYQGHALNLSLVGNLFDGPTPTWIVATSLKLDGGSCAANVMGAPCGSSGIKLTFMDSGAEIVNNGKNGYDPTVATVGPYVGSFEVGGSAAALTGYVLNMPGAILRITTAAATTVGQHCIDGTFQATDGSYNNMGAVVPVHYCFMVMAPPTNFAPSPPTSFPAIPTLGKFNTIIANTVIAKFEGFRTANTTFPGKYNNDSMSATQSAVDPWAIFNYGGGSVAFQIASYLERVTAAWQANHQYAIGDMFCSNGSTGCSDPASCVMVATVAGTSGTTQPSCVNPGLTKIDNTETWQSAGNVPYWNSNAQRVGQQSMNWQISMSLCCSGTWSEWSLLTQEDVIMDYFREGGALAENCNGSGSCNGLQQRALEGLANPLYKVAGANNQGCVWAYKSVPEDTIRTLPYCLDTLNDMQLLHNAPVVNSGVNEQQARVDLLLQALRETEDINPIEGATTNPYPCCIGTPTFDYGLAVKALVRYCTVQIEQGLQCDPIIPTELMKFADFYQSSQMVSNNTSPYNVWAYPGQTANGNQLNMLFAPVYAWGFAIWGDNCRLPTSGKLCRDAANAMAQSAITSTFFQSAKQMNQIFEWWGDFVGWLSGTQTWQQTSVLKSMNPKGALIPDQLEAYNAHSYPRAPAYSCTSTSCIINWVSYKHITTPKVMLAVNTGKCPTTYPLSGVGGTSTFIANSFTEWQNTAPINGLQPATSYCYGVGGTDDSGNVSFSTVSPISGNDYTLLTSSGPPPSLNFIPPPLPNGTQGAPYSQLDSGASGGVPPYTYSADSGLLPLTMNAAGLIAGVDNNAEVLNFTTQVCDQTPTCVSGKQSITITASAPNPVTIPPQKLPDGIAGQSYGPVQLMAQGGVPPYKFVSPTPPPQKLMLSASGVLSGTAPTTVGAYTITVEACDSESKAQCSFPVKLTLQVDPFNPVNVTTTVVPIATLGFPYSAQLSASGGSGTYKWSIVSGTLPEGLTFADIGVITGEDDKQVINAPMVFQATDANGQTGQSSTIIVPAMSPLLP